MCEVKVQCDFKEGLQVDRLCNLAESLRIVFARSEEDENRRADVVAMVAMGSRNRTFQFQKRRGKLRTKKKPAKFIKTYGSLEYRIM